MMPTQDRGHELYYDLGRYFSGRAQVDRLTIILENAGFDIVEGRIMPRFWNTRGQPEKEVAYHTRPVVGFVARDFLGGSYLFIHWTNLDTPAEQRNPRTSHNFDETQLRHHVQRLKYICDKFNPSVYSLN